MRDALIISIVTVVLAIAGALGGRAYANTGMHTGGGRGGVVVSNDRARRSLDEVGENDESLRYRRHMYENLGAWFFGGAGLVITASWVGIRRDRTRPITSSQSTTGHGTLVVTPHSVKTT